MWNTANISLASVYATKVAADEFACVVRRVFARHVSESDWRRIICETEDAVEFFDSQGWLERPCAYHEPPRPIRRVKTIRAQCIGLDFSHVSFESSYEPHSGEPGRSRWLGYKPNRTAHAWVVRHRGRPRPWLICIPGYGMGQPYFDMSAFSVPWLYSRLGLNVLIPVLPFHGPRRTQWNSGEGFFGGDCLDTIHAETQAVFELRQIIAWLREQDAPRIGLYGLSLGGYTAALVSAFERDLACVIAGIPPSDFISLARLHTPARILSTAEQLGMDWKKVERLFRTVSPLSVQPLVPKSLRFIFAGSGDRIVPCSQVEALCKHWKQPHTLWYRGGHLSFYWEREVSDWLRSILRASICADTCTRPSAPAQPIQQAA